MVQELNMKLQEEDEARLDAKREAAQQLLQDSVAPGGQHSSGPSPSAEPPVQSRRWAHFCTESPQAAAPAGPPVSPLDERCATTFGDGVRFNSANRGRGKGHGKGRKGSQDGASGKRNGGVSHPDEDAQSPKRPCMRAGGEPYPGQRESMTRSSLGVSGDLARKSVDTPPGSRHCAGLPGAAAVSEVASVWARFSECRTPGEALTHDGALAGGMLATRAAEMATPGCRAAASSLRATSVVVSGQAWFSNRGAFDDALAYKSTGGGGMPQSSACVGGTLPSRCAGVPLAPGAPAPTSSEVGSTWARFLSRG